MPMLLVMIYLGWVEKMLYTSCYSQTNCSEHWNLLLYMYLLSAAVSLEFSFEMLCCYAYAFYSPPFIPAYNNSSTVSMKDTSHKNNNNDIRNISISIENIIISRQQRQQQDNNVSSSNNRKSHSISHGFLVTHPTNETTTESINDRSVSQPNKQ